MLSTLTKSYLAELDSRAAKGDTRARDYGDVCRLEFEARLEGCVLALMKRDMDEGLSKWTGPEASTIVEPDTARRVSCDSTAVSPLRMRITPSEPRAPRQGSLF